MKNADKRATNKSETRESLKGMLRTDEAMIKTLHAYSFHWADRSRWVRPLTQEVIGMNIK